VNLPTLDDFEVQNIQSLVFIEGTKLCTIISRISELQAERRSISSEEHAAIREALSDWVARLPKDLQPCDAAGRKNAYCRPASELAIQYFVAIILSEFLRHRENPKTQRNLIPSLVAASCAAALYDEIHCRDESVFLPHIHGFFCLALALPLIHCAPQSSLKEATRKQDLGVLRSVLKEMCDRYGDGKMALRMIDDLEKNMGRTTSPYEVCEGAEELEPCIDAHRLFPFPLTFCANMDLLKQAAAPEDQIVAGSLPSVHAWPTDDRNFDFRWMDLFGLDFGDENMESENGS
jgi:hypothetical protein